MYAIAFDLEIAVLKTEYGDPTTTPISRSERNLPT